MPQFEDSQKKLTAARDEYAGAQDELFRARARLARVDKELRATRARRQPERARGWRGAIASSRRRSAG